MDTCGFAKDAFYQNKACFTKEPMLHILPHWNWNEGDTVRVMTVTNCEEVELFLNGESLGRRKSDVCDQCIWEVKFVPGKLSALAYNRGQAVASAERETTGAPARIVIEPDRNWIRNDGVDAVPLNLSVVDAQGRTVETASDKLEIELLGDAVLLGVGNGDPNCHESDHEPRRSLFAGHAQAIIQSAVGAEKIGVRVSGEGLESAELTLEVRDEGRPDYIYAAESHDITGFTVSTETFNSEPDILMEIADNDMNSLEPVTFDEWSVRSPFVDGYKLFRAFFNIPKLRDPKLKGICTLSIKQLHADHAEICVGDKIIFDGDTNFGRPFEVDFVTEKIGKTELRIVLRSDGDHKAGIVNGVRFGIR